MRLRPALFAVFMAAAVSCWFAVRAQPQNTSSTDRGSMEPAYLDSTQVATIAHDLAQRSERLKTLFEQVHAAEWVAKGAPETYVSQWSSVARQNSAIEADMASIAQHPEAMSDVMRALFRVHRFDADVTGLLGGLRRYQNASLADQIENAAGSDQQSVDSLQAYVLDLASQKEQLLGIEDKEAQRCRSVLANQPIARPTAAKKTSGTSK